MRQSKVKRKNKTQETFINQVREKYGEIIDYSLIEYKGTNEKVKIKCKFCNNVFERVAKDLLYKIKKENVCPYCFKNKSKKTFSNNFISNAKQIHNNKYDYSKVEYTDSKTKVCIICPIHGEFWQIPNSHLQGHGCPKCKEDSARLKTDIFIKRSNEMHRNHYVYNDVKYVNNKTCVRILCPEHGYFNMLPKQHLNGYGCPKCKESLLEREMCSFLDTNNIKYEQQKKFTWLSNNNFPLSLDFYLPEYNIAIECQGQQHFMPIAYYGGEQRYKKIIENDLLKIKLCQENGIKLIHKSNRKNFYPKIQNDWKYYNVLIENEDLIKLIKTEKEK